MNKDKELIVSENISKKIRGGYKYPKYPNQVEPESEPIFSFQPHFTITQIPPPPPKKPPFFQPPTPPTPNPSQPFAHQKSAAAKKR